MPTVRFTNISGSERSTATNIVVAAFSVDLDAGEQVETDDDFDTVLADATVRTLILDYKLDVQEVS